MNKKLITIFNIILIILIIITILYYIYLKIKKDILKNYLPMKNINYLQII